MKTIREVLIFCNEFTFYIPHKIERVIELNPVYDCIYFVPTEYDFLIDDNCIRVLGGIDDIYAYGLRQKR